MQILIHIYSRPNPQIYLGPVDPSCPLVVCDLNQPDQPIVYASPEFLAMTGYSADEVRGRNCRFLQSPDGTVSPRSTRRFVDRDSIRQMRKAVEKNDELRIDVVNFKKCGTRFINQLSIVPVSFGDNNQYRYSVGLMCERL